MNIHEAAAQQGDHRSGCQTAEKGVVGPECRFGGRGDIRGAVAKGAAVGQARLAAGDVQAVAAVFHELAIDQFGVPAFHKNPVPGIVR